VKLCNSFNATLVELDSSEKELIFLSFVGELGSRAYQLPWIWLNGRRDSSGKWKWINSGKDLKYNNWQEVTH
jgi:hypothetical protein